VKGKDTYGGHLFRLLKWVIGILFGWYLYRVLKAEGLAWPVGGLGQFVEGRDPLLLSLVVLLFPFNLVLEWFKWRLLLKRNVPFWWGMRTICTGLMAGQLSVSGLGDFAGRIWYLPVQQRVQGSWAAIAGGLVSSWANMLCFLPVVPYLLDAKGFWQDGVMLVYLKIFCWVVVGMMLALYTRTRYLPGLFSHLKWLKGWKASFEALGNYSRQSMRWVLVLSLLRFGIANVQLNLLWHVFGLELGFVEGFVWSIGLFGILSLVPTMFLTDIGVRGGVALWLMSAFAEESWQLLLPSYLLWLLNVILPAVLGWFSMWFLKRKPSDI
jgi:hypothetical protein